MIKATLIAASFCLSLAGYAVAQSDTSGAGGLSNSDSGANATGNNAAGNSTDGNGDISSPDQSDTNTKGNSATTTTTEQNGNLPNADGTETKCADGSARATQSGGTTGENATQGCKDGS